MKTTFAKLAAAAFIIAGTGNAAIAQSSDDAFIQCIRDCQDFQPDTKTVRQCENWCYIVYDPN